jgi:hypothetical protein
MLSTVSFRNLLFPVASPQQVKRELPGAERLASKLKANLTLMRVINPFHGGPKPISEEIKSLDPDGAGLDKHHLHLAANSDAAGSISTYAQENDVDAIIVPPAPSALPGVFSESWTLTRRLLNRSSCPIWVLPKVSEPSLSELNSRRVLCAVTGRDLQVLKLAGALSEKLNARLFLLHVIPEINEGTMTYGFDDHISLSTGHAVQMLSRLQEAAGVNAEVIIQTGSLARNIRKTAQHLSANLVVTGRSIRPTWSAPNLMPWSMPANYQTVVV